VKEYSVKIIKKRAKENKTDSHCYFTRLNLKKMGPL
jgi:hypothetical protein